MGFVECDVCELWHDSEYGSYDDNDNFRCNICSDSGMVNPVVQHDFTCIRCGGHDIEHGYGLAYGGFGAYTYCGNCGNLINKTQDKVE